MVELDKRIVLCRDCQQEVSSQARTCPHCGASYPANQDWSGSGFEWKSNATIYGYPLIHIAFGRDKEGKVRVARGIIAIGQFGIGLITFAQFGIGILFGFGQFVVGFVCIAQFAGGILFGLGQFACGYVAIGQLAVGYYALAQMGLAKYLWSMAHKDPTAIEFFRNLFVQIKNFLGK